MNIVMMILVIVIKMGCPETTFIIFGLRIHLETII